MGRPGAAWHGCRTARGREMAGGGEHLGPIRWRGKAVSPRIRKYPLSAACWRGQSDQKVRASWLWGAISWEAGW